MPALADRIKETTTTTGTGTYSLNGAEDGYQTFVAGIGTGNTCYYVVQGADGTTDWEVGIGTVTDAATDTLARTTVIASSNANAAVNWGAGTKTVFCTPPARNYLPARHNPTATAAPTATDDSSAGYSYGSVWAWDSASECYICVDPYPSGATWVRGFDLSRVKSPFSGSGTVIGPAGSPDVSSTVETYSVAMALYAGVNISGVQLYNVVLGGGGHVSTQKHVVFSGLAGLAKHRGAVVHGFTNANIDAEGNHQYERAGWVGQTTNATATELFLSDTSTPSARFVVPTDSVLYFTVRVAAIKNDGTQGAAYKIEGAVRRDGSADPAFIGTPTTTVLGEDDAAWDCALSIDTTNDSLKLTVTGVAATVINWTGVIDVVQAAFAPT